MKICLKVFILLASWPIASSIFNDIRFCSTYGDIPGEKCNFSNMECICLPATPPSDETPFELLDLLTRGSEFLKNYTNVPEAVLFLGNTGTGKTTATQIIGGNLSQLHSVVDRSKQLVIIDEENRIGLPSLKSKTLFPELVTKVENDELFRLYDFPGFDDTRGAAQDIAANYFMTEVVKKIATLKMLFFVTQVAVTGEIRENFDSLATHAVEFVKNINNFTNSFALIVNRVKNFNDFGEASDELVLEGIVGFLINYNNTIYGDLENGSDEEKEITIKKIKFVETILKQNENGDYDRIGFIRNPRKCGQLSNQTDYINGRKHIDDMLSKLEYTTVGDVNTNFGFTLKDSTIIQISNYTNAINNAVATAVTKTINETSTKYFYQIKETGLNLSSLAQNFKRDNEYFDKLVLEINEMSTGSISPNNLTKALEKFYKKIGFSISTRFEDFMALQSNVLEFFDKATGQYQRREIDQWKDAIVNFNDQFKILVDWYEFCITLQTKVYGLEIQKKKITLPTNIDNTNWLEFINKSSIIPLTKRIEDIAKIIPKNDLDVIKNVLVYALKVRKNYCITKPRNSLVVEGNFLQLNELQSLLVSLAKGCNNAKEIYLLASHTIFVEEDFKVEDLNVAFLAPNFEATKSVNLFLNGKTGSAPSPAASRGKDASSASQSATAGSHGCSGKPGGPGASAFFFVSNLHSSSVKVVTNGGNGGAGQTGGGGGNGFSPANARCCVNCSACDVPSKCSFPTSSSAIECVHNGYPGTDGANGGDGGIAGKGGYAGSNVVVHLESKSDKSQVVAEKLAGKSGAAGLGGQAGTGGKAGKGYINLESERCSAADKNTNGANGKKGSDNISGSCSEGLVNSEPIIEWSAILEFRKVFFNLSEPTTNSFFQKIDYRTDTYKYFTLQALAEESLALEQINRNNVNLDQLQTMYKSLIVKLEKFYQTQFGSSTPQHKKIMCMLLTSALAAVQNFRSKDLWLEVDIVSLLNNIETQIKTLAQIQNRDNMREYIRQAKEKLGGNTHSKINQAGNFVAQIVVKAVETAAQETTDNLAELGKQLEELIIDESLTLEEAQNLLTQAEAEQRKYKLWELFGVLSSIASGILPEVNIFKEIIDEIKMKHENEPEVLLVLEELVHTLEETSEELKETTEDFKHKYVLLVNTSIDYFLKVSHNFTVGGNISAPASGLTAVELLRKIQQCTNALDEFIDKSFIAHHLATAFSDVQDILTIVLDLYEEIEHYQTIQNLTKYSTEMQTSALGPIQITDPLFVHTLKDFDLNLKQNLLNNEVSNALHAFKQWVFPFAKFYNVPNISKTNNRFAGEGQVTQVEYIRRELDSYKTMVVGGHDNFIMQTNFSSGLKTSKPFFTWENDIFQNDIGLVLSGQLAYFKSDVLTSGFPGWEAIKFKQIEINFKLMNGAPENMQQELDDLLNYFAVTLTHSGLSYYRFHQDYFVMSGNSQTIMYNFETDARGNRLGTNMAYEKFKTGDFIMSPFTTWTIQLHQVDPTSRRSICRSNAGFEDLKIFEKYVNIELVGIGTYVLGEKALEAAKWDMELEKHYRKEIRLHPKITY